MTNVKKNKQTPAERAYPTLDLTNPSSPGKSAINGIAIWFGWAEGDRVRGRSYGSLPAPEGLSSTTWIHLLEMLGISPVNARGALHRMTKAGFLDHREVHGKRGYAMSSNWVNYLVNYTDAVRSGPEPPARWALLTFTIPESRRAERNAIRTILERYGFAPLGRGVWIASMARLEQTQLTLETSQLDGYIDVFEADYHGFGPLADLVARCWNVDAVAEDYKTFIGEVRQRLREPAEVSARSFTNVVQTSNAWRRAFFEDPLLPPSALPKNWPRDEAARLQEAILERFLDPGRAYVASLEE